MLTYNQLLLRYDALLQRVATYEKFQAATDIPDHKEVYQPTLADITLNEKQQEAVDLALAGESFVLTGAAGTGKTLAVNAIAAARMSKNKDLNPNPLPIATFRNPKGGVNDQEAKPAIAFVAFTNRAVNNMANNLRKLSPELMDDLYSNFMTIHKLIEVAPEYYFDAEDQRDKMRFVPRRDSLNRLPIKTLIIEEASMVDLTLWDKLFAALEPGTQIILLGDLNQLPPVFGASILNYGLITLPIVELTHVYRQALDSPIIRQMHRVLAGKSPVSDTEDFTVVTGKADKPVGPDRMGLAVASMMNKLYDVGKYSPSQDIILTPFNKNGCGTIMINKLISSWLDRKAEALGSPNIVYEINSGIMKHYYAVGDIVYDAASKMQGTITRIHNNGNYYGTATQPASKDLSRFGILTGAAQEASLEEEYACTVFDIDALANSSMTEAEQKVLSASHVITIRLEDEEIVERSSVGDVNGLDFGYALTTHKAQGCEWDNVFVVIHDSHFLANREWLYTSGTRAKVSCTIMARADTLDKVVKRQRIKGDTLEAKVQAFNDKLVDSGADAPKVSFIRSD